MYVKHLNLLYKKMDIAITLKNITQIIPLLNHFIIDFKNGCVVTGYSMKSPKLIDAKYVYGKGGKIKRGYDKFISVKYYIQANDVKYKVPGGMRYSTLLNYVSKKLSKRQTVIFNEKLFNKKEMILKKPAKIVKDIYYYSKIHVPLTFQSYEKRHLFSAEHTYKKLKLEKIEYKKEENGFTLYPNQCEANDIVEKQLRSINYAFVQAPTGSGKSYLGTDMIHRLGGKWVIVVPRTIIIDGWKKAIKMQFGIDIIRLTGPNIRKSIKINEEIKVLKRSRVDIIIQKRKNHYQELHDLGEENAQNEDEVLDRQKQEITKIIDDIESKIDKLKEKDILEQGTIFIAINNTFGKYTKVDPPKKRGSTKSNSTPCVRYLNSKFTGIIIDEAHNCLAKTVRSSFDTDGEYILAFSATPIVHRNKKDNMHKVAFLYVGKPLNFEDLAPPFKVYTHFVKFKAHPTFIKDVGMFYDIKQKQFTNYQMSIIYNKNRIYTAIEIVKKYVAEGKKILIIDKYINILEIYKSMISKFCDSCVLIHGKAKVSTAVLETYQVIIGGMGSVKTGMDVSNIDVLLKTSPEHESKQVDGRIARLNSKMVDKHIFDFVDVGTGIVGSYRTREAQAKYNYGRLLRREISKREEEGKPLLSTSEMEKLVPKTYENVDSSFYYKPKQYQVFNPLDVKHIRPYMIELLRGIKSNKAGILTLIENTKVLCTSLEDSKLLCKFDENTKLNKIKEKLSLAKILSNCKVWQIVKYLDKNKLDVQINNMEMIDIVKK